MLFLEYLGKLSLIFRWENAKYCLVGSQLCMTFQRKSWIFLGQCTFHTQFHTYLSRGTCCCWYIKCDAHLTELIPLLWGHTKVYESRAILATRIPWISCLICGGRGTWREVKSQVWATHKELTWLFSSFRISGLAMRLRSACAPGIQWSSHILILWPSPIIHFIPSHSHWIPLNKAFQICEPLEVLVISNRLVCGKNFAFNTWAQSIWGEWYRHHAWFVRIALFRW